MLEEIRHGKSLGSTSDSDWIRYGVGIIGTVASVGIGTGNC